MLIENPLFVIHRQTQDPHPAAKQPRFISPDFGP